MSYYIASGPSSPSGSSYIFGIDWVSSFERKRVRVTFSQPILARDRTNPNDALFRDNWTITPIEPPTGESLPVIAFVTVVLLRVEIVPDDPYSVDLVVDHDFTFDVDYNLTVNTRVQPDTVDTWALDGPADVDFAPYDPACRNKPMPRVYDWLGTAVKRLDATRDAEKFAAIMQEIFEQIKSLNDCLQELFVPERTPIGFLDSRLESLGNPFAFFTSEMNAREKRLVALQLVNIYRQKGTNQGIENALLKIIGIEATVISINEKSWCLDDDALSLGGLFTLGAAVYPSVYPPVSPGVPLEPLDEYLPANDPYMGTARLNSEEPSYIHSFLGSNDDEYSEARYTTTRLDGRWNLLGDGMPTYPFQPDEFTPIGLVAEPGRHELYSYSIAVDRALTAIEVIRITTIAKYMQPAARHLTLIRTPEGAYNPSQLDFSKLDFDFILHS